MTNHRIRKYERARARGVVVVAALVVLSVITLLPSSPSSASKSTDDGHPPDVEETSEPDEKVVTGVEEVEVSEASDGSPSRVVSEEEMMEWLAEEHSSETGVSLQVARQRMERQEALTSDIAQLVDLEGDRVAGWGIDSDPIYTGFVLLKGEDPGTASGQAFASELPDLEIRTGASHSFGELKKAQELLLHGGQQEHGLSKVAMETINGSAIDLEGNAIELMIEPGSRKAIEQDRLENSRRTRAKSQSEAFATASARTLEEDELWPSLGIKVNVVEESATFQAAQFQAGETMTGGNGPCTSGFSFRYTGRPNGVGLVTAGHCGEGLFMRGKRLTTRPGGKIYNRAGDAQFHAIRYKYDKVAPTFQCGTQSSCYVARKANQSAMQGVTVCHYGRQSKKSCGRVTRNFYAPSRSACGERTRNCFPVWVLVQGTNLVACPSDSGAPVFRGLTAYGILSGGVRRDPRSNECSARNTTSMYFYPITQIERNLPSLQLRLNSDTTKPLGVGFRLGNPVRCPRGLGGGGARVEEVARVSGFEPYEAVQVRKTVHWGIRRPHDFEDAGRANSKGEFVFRDSLFANCLFGGAGHTLTAKGMYNRRWITFGVVYPSTYP